MKGLKLNNVRFHVKTNDVRPAVIVEDGKDIELYNCSIPQTSGGESIIRLVNVDGAAIKNTETKATAATFVKVEGNASKSIRLFNNKSACKKQIELASDVRPNVVLN